jgi:hypothetical protein
MNNRHEEGGTALDPQLCCAAGVHKMRSFAIIGKEASVAAKLVVGLFPASGVALDAYHRLHTEGFPESRLACRILKEVGPPPASVQAELQALQIDPMVLGDARHTFARFIHNGETALFVQVEDDDEARSAADIMKIFSPLAVETVVSGGGDR